MSYASQDALFRWPVRHGATDMVNGAILMPGITAGTNLGVLIVAATAGADAIGMLKGPIDASEVTDTAVAGTTWNVYDCELIAPVKVIRMQYDASDTVTVDGGSSSTTVTITSLEDNIDTSWLYIVSGDAVGQLAYLTASASGSCTTKTALNPAAGTSDTAIKILRLFHQLVKINGTADKIGTDAAAGSWTVVVLQNYIERNGATEILDPTKHDALTGLNAAPVRFFADIGIRNTAVYTTE